MDNLKPCPFCGGEDVKVIAALGEEHCVDCWLEDLPSYGGKSSNYYVVCLKCQGNSGYRRTPQEAIDNWNRRPVAKKTKVENLKHLLDLVSLNPDLPVLPIVDTDCVVSDDYGYWLASIGSVEVTKILDDINYCKDGRFYREDDFDEIVEDLVSESDDPLDEEEAEDIVKTYPWRKVILVYIIPGWEKIRRCKMIYRSEYDMPVYWEYEDRLPDISPQQLDLMFPLSRIIGGVRMYPYVYDNEGARIYLGLGRREE